MFGEKCSFQAPWLTQLPTSFLSLWIRVPVSASVGVELWSLNFCSIQIWLKPTKESQLIFLLKGAQDSVILSSPSPASWLYHLFLSVCSIHRGFQHSQWIYFTLSCFKAHDLLTELIPDNEGLNSWWLFWLAALTILSLSRTGVDSSMYCAVQCCTALP